MTGHAVDMDQGLMYLRGTRMGIYVVKKEGRREKRLYPLHVGVARQVFPFKIEEGIF